MNTKNLILTSLFTISLLIVLTSLGSFKTTIQFKKEVELFKSNNEIVSPIPMYMYENIEKYSTEYNIPKYIAYNISYLETRYQGPFHWGYNPSQISCVGALGPMQIMPGTAKLIQKRRVPNEILKNDIRLNIEISMKLLRKLYKHCLNLSKFSGFFHGEVLKNIPKISSDTNYSDYDLYKKFELTDLEIQYIENNVK